MNFRQLTYFVTCARTGSIAAAARELDVAQPSISQQLAALEHELRIQLLERDHRGVRLTAAGQRFCRFAGESLARLEVTRRELNAFSESPSGRVRLAMTQPTGNVLAVPLYAQISRTFSAIELDLYTGLSNRLYRRLRQQEVDLLICSDDGSDHMGMVSEVLLAEKLVLAVSCRADGQFAHLRSRNSIDFKELADYPVMFTGPDDSLGFCVANYEKHTGIKLRRQATFGQLMTSLNYVAEGFGLIICPTTAIHSQLRDKTLHALEITNPVMTREVSLVKMHDSVPTPAVEAIAQTIRELAQTLIRDGVWQVADPTDLTP